MAATTEQMFAAPGWFAEAVAELPEHREVVVDGAAIHLRHAAVRLSVVDSRRCDPDNLHLSGSLRRDPCVGCTVP